MNIEDIENLKVEKRKELIELIKNKEAVELELIDLSRKILELQIKKKDLNTISEKAKSSEKQLRLEIRNLEEQYWSIKHL